MYEFHYKYIKTKYNAKLLFTDRDKGLFGFSDYPQDLKFFDLVHKNIIDKIKDEFKGKIIGEFVGLKSKMYSSVDIDGREIKKAKGVNESTVNNITHKEFVDVLFNKK